MTRQTIQFFQNPQNYNNSPFHHKIIAQMKRSNQKKEKKRYLLFNWIIPILFKVVMDYFHEDTDVSEGSLWNTFSPAISYISSKNRPKQ